MWYEVPMFGQRVYTYTDDDGNIYWSLTRRDQTISSSIRLVLESRVGTHANNFLVQLRKKVEALWLHGPHSG